MRSGASDLIQDIFFVWKTTRHFLKKMEGGVVNLEGNISAGKSTMSDLLADYCTERGFDVVVLKETIDKEALQHFNENPKENGLVFQKTMMNLRLGRYAIVVRL